MPDETMLLRSVGMQCPLCGEQEEVLLNVTLESPAEIPAATESARTAWIAEHNEFCDAAPEE